MKYRIRLLILVACIAVSYLLRSEKNIKFENSLNHEDLKEAKKRGKTNTDADWTVFITN